MGQKEGIKITKDRESVDRKLPKKWLHLVGGIRVSISRLLIYICPPII